MVSSRKGRHLFILVEYSRQKERRWETMYGSHRRFMLLRSGKMDGKVCCFIGHRNVKKTIELKKN